MAAFERNQPLSLRTLNAIADRAKGSLNQLVTEVPWAPVPAGAVQSSLPFRTQEVVLLQNWDSCGKSTGHAIYWQTDLNGDSGQYYIDTTTKYILDDPLGKIQWLLAAIDNGMGEFYLPAGYLVTVWQPFDTANGHWRPLVAGTLCEEGSGSEGGSLEESSEEGSEIGSEEGSEGGSEEGSGSGGGGGGCAQPCCPDTATCDAAPLLKATATFPPAHTAANFSCNLTESACQWTGQYIGGGDAVQVAIRCINGCWVISVSGTIPVNIVLTGTTDPVACASPYPPSGTYIVDVGVAPADASPITIVIGKQ